LCYCTTASAGVALSGGTAWTGSTWSISGLSWSHQHIYSSVCSHRHLIIVYSANPGGTYLGAGLNPGVHSDTVYTGYTGDAPPCSSETISGNPSSDGSWRPAAVVCIVATKD